MLFFLNVFIRVSVVGDNFFASLRVIIFGDVVVLSRLYFAA